MTLGFLVSVPGFQLFQACTGERIAEVAAMFH